MKVAVLFEYSGVVRDAFIGKGHNAVSVDILPSDSEAGPHHRMDIDEWFRENTDRFDLIIMHPPCTALAVSGNSTYGEGQRKYQERLDAVKRTVSWLEQAKQISGKVCLENPVGVLPRLGGLGKPQYIQPYWFGHMEQKKTGLWLHNLPMLIATNNVYDAMQALPNNERQRLFYLPPSKDRAKLRSKTFTGIAEAMAEQWG